MVPERRGAPGGSHAARGAFESCSPRRSPPRPCSGCTRGPSADHAALAVGEDLDPLDETGWVRSGRRQRVGGVEGDLDRLGVDERGPLVRGMRQTLEVAGEKELSELGKYCTSCRAVT